MDSVSRLFVLPDKEFQIQANGICAALSSQGMTRDPIAGTAPMLKALEVGLAPGCYDWVPDGALESKKPLMSTFASIIRVTNTNLDWSAPKLSLGPVILSTLIQQPPQKANAPFEVKAMTFPLLLGVTLAEDSPQFSKGTHFFIYHYVFRKAENGRAEGKPSLFGISGPSLQYPIKGKG